MKKKAMSISQLPGLIVALLICLGLGYLIIKLIYDRPEITGEKKVAIEFLDLLKKRIDLVPQNGEGAVSLLGFDANGLWYLAGWNEDELTSPDRCVFKSCLCICKADSSPNKKLTEECQKGYCVPTNVKTLTIEHTFSEQIIEREIGLDPNEPAREFNRGQQSKTADIIPIKNLLLNFQVKKSQDSLKISLN